MMSETYFMYVLTYFLTNLQGFINSLVIEQEELTQIP